MRITVFDVGHGGCALVEAPSGAKMMIDCGRQTDGWSPSIYLKERGITQLDALVITNYDEDHAADLVELRKQVGITTLYRNRSVSPENIAYLKSETGMGLGIKELCSMAQEFIPFTDLPGQVGPAIDWGGVTFKGYMNSPIEFDDENNLSMAWFLNFNGFCILFPGDLETAGWKSMLKQPGFIEDLKKVHILVASHHGRENGCCDEIFTQTGWKPMAVLISDDEVYYGTQEGVSQWYHRRSTGIKVGDGSMTRHVITTRKDGHVFIIVGTDGSFNVTTPAYERQKQNATAKTFASMAAAMTAEPQQSTLGMLGQLGGPTSALSLWEQLKKK